MFESQGKYIFQLHETKLLTEQYKYLQTNLQSRNPGFDSCHHKPDWCHDFAPNMNRQTLIKPYLSKLLKLKFDLNS